VAIRDQLNTTQTANGSSTRSLLKTRARVAQWVR